MDAKQARYIRKTLIPFIKREQGRGFAMEVMLDQFDPGDKMFLDSVDREIPKCGTVACIAGSAVATCKLHSTRPTAVAARLILGLTTHQANVLFYGWENAESWGNIEEDTLWPKKFRNEYDRAKTTRGKASVACRLLELVAKTRGKCLDPIKKKVGAA